MTQQRLEIGLICTWQSILGTFESFWSLGLRMGARFQTVTLSIIYDSFLSFDQSIMKNLPQSSPWPPVANLPPAGWMSMEKMGWSS